MDVETLSMALGTTSIQPRFENPREILGNRLREGSIYRLLVDEGDLLFPDDYFADLYTRSVRGRPTVPARVLAMVTVFQALEGLSDREAIDHLDVDLRRQAACGVDAGAEAFHPTARHHRTGEPIAISTQRERVQVVGRMLNAMTEWGWPESPRRRLVFERDSPRRPRPLPRYLPADVDRRLAEALVAAASEPFAN